MLAPGTTLVTAPPGYLLSVEPEQLDAFQFEQLVLEAQQRAGSGEPSAAAELLDRALGLWRGAAFAEFADAEFRVDRSAAPRRAPARGDRGAGGSEAEPRTPRRAGRRAQGITVANPLAERPRGLLMLGLYRCGRPAEALRGTRSTGALRAELGIDPSPALARLLQRRELPIRARAST